MKIDINVFSTRNMQQEFRHILWNVRGFRPAYAFHRFLQGKQRILILGETSGRDSHLFSSYGKDVFVVDITSSSYKIERLILADITKPLPFPNSYFDGIVLGEVIEHLIDDVASLKEARRVLADDGILAISVPFFSEWPGVHVRLHSASTIRVLLEHSGFMIEEMLGTSSWMRDWHYAIQLLCTVSFHVAHILKLAEDRDDIYFPILKFIVDRDFQSKRITDLRTPSHCHEAYIKVRKSVPKDFLGLQVEVFAKVSTR